MKQIIQFIKKFFIKKQAQGDFKDWEKRVTSVDRLSKEDREIWYDEQAEFWKSWYGE
jgi:hypothetical protein